MKKIIFMALVAILSVFSGCSKEDPEEKVNNDGAFVGTVMVKDAVAGTAFTDPQIQVLVTKESAGTYSIMFNHVKFAEKMPVRLDITIPGVTIDSDGNITGNDIIPLAMGGEYPAYTVTSLKGNLESDKNGQYKTIEFSLKFGSYPTSFSGSFEAFIEE